MKKPVLFLDDGGVMNDNAQRGPQWQRLVGEFFSPRMGGVPDAWAEANRTVAPQLWLEQERLARQDAVLDYADFDRDAKLAWLCGMCERVGVAAPPDDDESYALARCAGDYVTRRVRAAFPGAAEAIRHLHAQGYVLHTASAEALWELAGYLEGMGIRDCFGRLYGPDLVNAFKGGRKYYQRVFEDAGVSPGEALVVDDNAGILRHAGALGARTVQVGQADAARDMPGHVVASLAELPALLAGLA